jgi:hypothetical protein
MKFREGNFYIYQSSFKVLSKIGIVKKQVVDYAHFQFRFLLYEYILASP